MAAFFEIKRATFRRVRITIAPQWIIMPVFPCAKTLTRLKPSKTHPNDPDNGGKSDQFWQ